jgi:hypothetical protein
MVKLTNLDGRAIPETNAVFFEKAWQIRWLTRDTALTAAKDNGAINIWIDDFGQYRCEAMRNFMSLEKGIFTKKFEVRDWAEEWLKKIE